MKGLEGDRERVELTRKWIRMWVHDGHILLIGVYRQEERLR